jgi:hypothetical protein
VLCGDGFVTGDAGATVTTGLAVVIAPYSFVYFATALLVVDMELLSTALVVIDEVEVFDEAWLFATIFFAVLFFNISVKVSPMIIINNRAIAVIAFAFFVFMLIFVYETTIHKNVLKYSIQNNSMKLFI